MGTMAGAARLGLGLGGSTNSIQRLGTALCGIRIGGVAFRVLFRPSAFCQTGILVQSSELSLSMHHE